MQVVLRAYSDLGEWFSFSPFKKLMHILLYSVNEENDIFLSGIYFFDFLMLGILSLIL